MAITSVDKSVVNENISGRLNSKLMKTDECCFGKCDF